MFAFDQPMKQQECIDIHKQLTYLDEYVFTLLWSEVDLVSNLDALRVHNVPVTASQ